jgi:Holliday junction resolvase RusA-like endonuclease
VQVWSFRVAGQPVAQGRPRACIRAGRAAVYSPRAATAARQAIAHAARAAGLPVLVGDPLVVTIDAVRTRPRALCRRADPPGLIACPARPDADNLAKLVLDALAGHFDDALVAQLIVRKWYAERGGDPRTEVTVARLIPAERSVPVMQRALDMRTTWPTT